MDPTRPHGFSPFEEQFFRRESVRDVASGLAFYALGGALDPKAPVVDVPIFSRVSGLGYWAAYATQLPYAVLGGVFVGVVFDPASKFDNWGVDEVWHHVANEDPWYIPGSV